MRKQFLFSVLLTVALSVTIPTGIKTIKADCTTYEQEIVESVSTSESEKIEVWQGENVVKLQSVDETQTTETSTSEETTSATSETTTPEETTSPKETTTDASTKKENKVKNGWDKSTRYYKKGKYLTGFKKIKGHYYYFKNNGKVYTGWKKIKGKYYYFRYTGGLGTKGQARVGLVKIHDRKYYFKKNGQLVTGWKKIDGKYYYFKETGKAGVKGRMYTGLRNVNGEKYYFASSGVMKTGFITVDEKTYFFRKHGKIGVKGAARKGWITYNKNCYYFSKSSGVLKKNTIVEGYKLDNNGASKTRYLVLKAVKNHTTQGMTNNQKIYSLFTYAKNFSYLTGYEHLMSTWTWAPGWTDDFAYKILTTGSGNCYKYAAAYAYMIKEATGYKVRVYHGYIPTRSGALSYHGWCTVQINGTWYLFDPEYYPYGGAMCYYTVYSRYTYYYQKGVYTALN